ncbi:MAG: SdpI family protein [Beduini sp.]|uniref:SdpI family protein n=1 Tax=Beduini sp. TaxID=1922300 RepID=UPI0039A18307
MKTKQRVLYFFMLLPLGVTLASLFFLPAQIPTHYDFNNQVTRWGSKYETLIVPLCVIVFGFFMLGMAKYSAKQERNGRNNENVCLVSGIGTLILFNAMTFYFLYTDFNKVENLSSVSLDLHQMLFGIFGIFMIILGNIIPKVRMNSMIGLRTSWSMKNEMTWKKSQRFGGITFIIGGIAAVAVSLFTKGMACMVAVMSIFIVLLIADVYYTYHIAKKYG